MPRPANLVAGERAMPLVKAGSIALYYEMHGQGFPLVLIRGLGSNADHWYCQVPTLSRRFNVVIFDNRGIARSEKSKDPITIAVMAQDTVALMQGLGISKAHVLGISLGGMVAQEIAMRFPEKVRGLVLGCTHCGGGHVVRKPITDDGITPEDLYSDEPATAAKALKILFAEKTLHRTPQVIERYLEASRAHPPSREILRKQREAVMGFDFWGNLPKIDAPTLVITGAEDVLVPPENSKLIAGRIPGARLEIVADGGHQFMVEQPEVANRLILDFLLGSNGRPKTIRTRAK